MTEQANPAPNDADDDEDVADFVLTNMIVSVSDFKKNPNRYVARLGTETKEEAFAVMTNNKASFYVVTPKFFDYLLDLKWEADNYEMIKERVASIETEGLVSVDIKDLLNDDVFAEILETGNE
ncbi:MAG: hypothetical protein EBR84_00570 [Actinobacteria bacterium]|nr:hypothetical protein [Actinomycetota bacterium]